MLYRADRLTDVHPDLIRLLQDAGNGGLDLIVIQGSRTVEEEETDMAHGTSSLHNPMDSKHVIDPLVRPLALAVDVAPFDHPPTQDEWKDIPAFQRQGSNLKALADTIGVSIAWGGDWHSFKDWDHFELTGQHG